jgi:hypothetical protein
MKAYGGTDVWIHIFLTSALNRGEWSASRPCRFTPGETASDTHWMGRWADPNMCLKAVEKRKNLTPVGIRTSAFHPVGRRYTDWAIPTPMTPPADILNNMKIDHKTCSNVLPSSSKPILYSTNTRCSKRLKTLIQISQHSIHIRCFNSSMFLGRCL